MGAQRPGGCGRVRQALARLFDTPESREASELQQVTEAAGGVAVASCRDREYVTLAGRIRTVTLRPGPDVSALEADLYDGSGIVTLVWIGRRRIPGIEPGRGIRVSGRVAVRQDHLVMYNPRYELRPEGE